MGKKTVFEKKTKTRRFYDFFLLIAFFLSGATSLSLEVSWSKELSYLLGVDIYGATTVVTAFMAGLGIGALLVARFCKWTRASIKSYGILQLVIGICGLVSIPVFRSTLPLFSFLYDQLNYDSGFFLLARFTLVFGLMLIPVILMGMTLPLVVGVSYGRVKGRFAYRAGLLYGVNTIGAVAGTLVAGFVLIPTVGIFKTCFFTGMVDFGIGIAVLWFARLGAARLSASGAKTRAASAEFDRKGESHGVRKPFLEHRFSWPAIVFLLSGMLALALEIIWFRLLARIIGPSVHAFSIMLVIYLLGIGVGSVAGSSWVRRLRDHRMPIAVLLFVVGTCPLVTLLLINRLPIWYGRLFLWLSQDVFTVWNLMIQGLIASILIFPATLAFGAMFPLITRAYGVESTATGRQMEASVGTLYFYNTMGGIIGSLAAGFWLLPVWGVKTSIIIVAIASLVLSAVLFQVSFQGSRIKKALCGGIFVVPVLLMAFSPKLDHTILNAGLFSEMINKKQFRQIDSKNPDLGRLLFFHEGINNSVAVVANKFKDGNLTLHLTGNWVSTTEFHGRFHLKFLSHLPMLFARQHRTVGVIGYGTGITAGTTLQYPDVERVNIFELEPGVIKASAYFDYINQKPLEDPRTHLYMVDGRSHLTYEKFHYDVITADPIHPHVAGAGNLYTRDFYQIAEDRLNPGGIFCQWIPLAGISPESYNAILNTVHDVFPHTALFSFFGESVVLGSKTPIRIDWAAFEKRFYSPAVFEDFKSLDIRTPYNLVSFFMGGEQQIDAYLSDTRIICSDDNVWLEHHMPDDLYDRSLKNLYFMLREKIHDDGFAALVQILPGLSLNQLARELAGLVIDGDAAYQLAQRAGQAQNYRLMEKYLKETFADFNSLHFYAAGLELADYLSTDQRIDEAVSILHVLQKNHPAFSHAFGREAAIMIRMGKKENATSILKQGLMFSPGDPVLEAMLET